MTIYSGRSSLTASQFDVFIHLYLKGQDRIKHDDSILSLFALLIALVIVGSGRLSTVQCHMHYVVKTLPDHLNAKPGVVDSKNL